MLRPYRLHCPFLALASVMYITRRMNWYELKLGNPAV